MSRYQRIKRSFNAKGVVGFVILAIGAGIGIQGNGAAIQDSKDRGKVTRGIICSILTASDEQGLRNLPAEAKLLHVSLAELEKFEHTFLKQSGTYRAKLAPAVPPGVCSAKETTLAHPPVKSK